MSGVSVETVRIEPGPAGLDADRVLRRLADDTEALALLAAGTPATSTTQTTPAYTPVASGREQLLTRLDQDRRELATVTAQLRGPVQTLATARNALIVAGKSLRWIALAGHLAGIAVALRKGRRPTVGLLLGASLQVLGAWSARATGAGPAERRPAR